MLEITAIILLAIFLISLSGFWLGFFLGKVTTYHNISNKLDEIIAETLTTNYDTEDSDIVKNLTQLIREITIDKTPQLGYNDLNNQPKHKNVSRETLERTLE